jgi:chemotaxis family two-component system response regulator Rcp1
MAGVLTVRLLVVEDDPGYRYLVQRAFSARGEETRWELTIAKDGEEALHALFEEEGESARLPDLILLDWNLPKVSGNEVLRRVKRDQARRRIPVLVFSSSTSDKDMRAAYEEHANGYIVKPSGIDALDAVVERIERFWSKFCLGESRA